MVATMRTWRGGCTGLFNGGVAGLGPRDGVVLEGADSAVDVEGLGESRTRFGNRGVLEKGY